MQRKGGWHSGNPQKTSPILITYDSLRNLPREVEGVAAILLPAVRNLLHEKPCFLRARNSHAMILTSTDGVEITEIVGREVPSSGGHNELPIACDIVMS
jgi:hypothetical protein